MRYSAVDQVSEAQGVAAPGFEAAADGLDVVFEARWEK
jgi:hypothetical protein